MEKFEKVTVVKAANVYMDGKVTSRTILLDSGEKKSLGIILPGEYEFSSGDKEIMELLSGSMKILLPTETEWKIFRKGDTFEIPANIIYKLEIGEVTDYCCSFIKE